MSGLAQGTSPTAQGETMRSGWMADSQSKPPEMEAKRVNIPGTQGFIGD